MTEHARHAATVIAPSQGRFRSVDWREVWTYRELLVQLVLRDIKVRYKQTALGAGWAILQPIIATVIFTIVFGRVAGIPSGDLPYPLFAFAGILLWTYFSNAVVQGGNSLVNNANLVTKVYFPRLLVPLATVGAGLVDLLIASVLLLVLMAWYGVAPTPYAVLLPVVVLATTVLAAGVSAGLAALNVRYRDVRHVLPFVVQIWLYATPVIYPLALVARRWRWVTLLNPMTPLVVSFRSAALGDPRPEWSMVLVGCGWAAAALFVGSLALRRAERVLADIV